MSKIDDKLTILTNAKQYKKNAKREPKCIQEVIHMIINGTFNYNNPGHRKKLQIAIDYGYVDKNLNILEES